MTTPSSRCAPDSNGRWRTCSTSTRHKQPTPTRSVASHDWDAESALADGESGQPVTLRYIAMHLIEETARHNGHLDILRELADGVTGV